MLKPVRFGLVLVLLVLLAGACQPQPQTVYVQQPPQQVSNPVDDAINFFNQGNYAESKRILLKEASYNSTDPRVYVYLGRIYMYENECPSALAQFQRAVALDPGYYEGKQQLALAEQKCGKRQPNTGYRKPAEPKPRESNEFKGGAKAINPEKF